MKSKKRHHGSSDESEEWDINAKSSSTSESESEDSSISEHRHKKKRKRAESSESDSNSDDAKRSKKRKHKKKKKKHGKKKRRAESVESADNASVSEGEVVSKKKKKHKHKHKRTRTTTNTNTEVINSSEEEEGVERRLHSVVKERRSSLGDANQPSRTYYQKEYRRSASVENYGHENEVPRFYQGSSKEQHKYHANDQYNYNRQHNDRFLPQTEKYDNTKEKYAQSGRYHNIHEENNFKQRDYEEFKRPRYEERRPEEDYNKKPREKIPYYREDARETFRFKQYEERGPKRREFFDARDNRDRRGPQDPDRFRDREFVDKVEKLREDRYSTERNRDPRRERPGRVEKPQVPRQREASRSPGERFRERNKRGGERGGVRSGERGGERDVGAGRDGGGGGGGRDGGGSGGGGGGREARRPEPARPRQRKTRFADADDKEYTWGKTEVKKEGGTEGDKEKPNFGLSGKLTADANTVNGVVVKYTEPDDAKQPKRRWRFYPFKGDKALPILYIHRQSCFLIGRDRAVADIPLEHPSVSKQHAALQYRAAAFARADGSQGRRVRPYIIDLESANGTFVNNKKIEARRYVELLERDVVKFGFSQREYVLLHENSKDDAQDDDQDPLPATTDQIKNEKRIKEELVADGD